MKMLEENMEETVEGIGMTQASEIIANLDLLHSERNHQCNEGDIWMNGEWSQTTYPDIQNWSTLGGLNNQKPIQLRKGIRTTIANSQKNYKWLINKWECYQ